MPDTMPDTEPNAYLAGWAQQVAASVTPDELARLVKDYREQSRNPRRSAADREFARKRAKALAGCEKRIC